MEEKGHDWGSWVSSVASFGVGIATMYACKEAGFSFSSAAIVSAATTLGCTAGYAYLKEMYEEHKENKREVHSVGFEKPRVTKEDTHSLVKENTQDMFQNKSIKKEFAKYLSLNKEKEVFLTKAQWDIVKRGEQFVRDNNIRRKDGELLLFNKDAKDKLKALSAWTKALEQRGFEMNSQKDRGRSE